MADYAYNRKAHFEYELLDTYEAGIELLGHEVKSIRNNRVNIESAHIIITNGEAFVIGMNIEDYQQHGTTLTDKTRTRKLLLHKKEIEKLVHAKEKDRLTIIPISLYNKDRKIKLSLAIARGKKSHDKRETLKKRDLDRDMRREYKVR